MSISIGVGSIKKDFFKEQLDISISLFQKSKKPKGNFRIFQHWRNLLVVGKNGVLMALNSKGFLMDPLAPSEMLMPYEYIIESRTLIINHVVYRADEDGLSWEKISVPAEDNVQYEYIDVSAEDEPV